MHASNPSELLSHYCDHLRQLDAARRNLGPTSVPALVARFARALLRQCPGDTELSEVVRRLAERDFALPAPAPESLPLEAPGAIYARWSAEDRESVASAIIALPSFQEDPLRVLSLFELFVRTPRELGRARLLLDMLPANTEGVSLLGYRLALAEHHAAKTRPDWGKLLQPLRRLPDPTSLRSALRLASSFELQQMEPASRPLGLDWLVPLGEGTAVANVALALLRRPALGEEAPRIIDWLVEAGQPEWLAMVDEADRRGDFAKGSELLRVACQAHALPDEGEAANLARAKALADPDGGTEGTTATFALPTFVQGSAPINGWNSIILAILERDPATLESTAEAVIADAIGDRRLVAEFRLQHQDPAAARDAALLGRARVLSELGLSPPTDEREIAKNPDAALICHHLMSPGLERSLLALRILGANIPPLSTSHVAADADDDSDHPPEVVVPQDDAGASRDPDDGHAPEQRLAAARILFDSNQFDASAAIAISLIRKTDRATGAAELYPLIADLLALDEPPEDLVAYVRRALDDDKKNAALLTLFAGRPLAAYGLHEDLYDFAMDPSRPDHKRLLALIAWLGIWRATETAPDAWALGRIRQTSEALVCVAGASLSGSTSPLATASLFMRQSDELDEEPYAEALLSLSLNRMIFET